jgi:hypothetical protein
MAVGAADGLLIRPGAYSIGWSDPSPSWRLPAAGLAPVGHSGLTDEGRPGAPSATQRPRYDHPEEDGGNSRR